MALFKTPIRFRGLEEGKVFKKDEEIEMTVKRSKEIQKNLKDNYGLEVEFERLDVKEKEDEKEAE